jgi:hypothetical protein
VHEHHLYLLIARAQHDGGFASFGSLQLLCFAGDMVSRATHGLCEFALLLVPMAYANLPFD